MLICPELFMISVFDPCISRGRFLGCKRSTYTQGKYGTLYAYAIPFIVYSIQVFGLRDDKV